MSVDRNIQGRSLGDASALKGNTGWTTKIIAFLSAIVVALSFMVVTEREAQAVSYGPVTTGNGQSSTLEINDYVPGVPGPKIGALFELTDQNGDMNRAYCIERTVPFIETKYLSDKPYAASWDEFPGTNKFDTDQTTRERVNWIVANSYPTVPLEELQEKLGITNLTEDAAISQTQAAIWSLTEEGYEYNGLLGTTFEDEHTLFKFLTGDENVGRPEKSIDATQIELVESADTLNEDGLFGPFSFEANDSFPVFVDGDAILVDAEGNEIDSNNIESGQKIFLKPTAPAGKANLVAYGTESEITGNIVVSPNPDQAYYRASHGQTIIVTHDADRSVRVPLKVSWESIPELSTSAKDQADGDKEISAEGGVVVDTVSYKGLTPGHEYTVKGELMDKETGEPTGIKGSATFTPESAEGTVDVEFEIPEGFAGKTLVAFEGLYDENDCLVAEHTDINDEAQTVTVDETTPTPTPTPEDTTPEIDTTATDLKDGDKVIDMAGGIVVDKVEYTGLTAGETYTLTGELMDKETGAATGITATKTFVATEANGFEELEFLVPAGNFGKTLVAFETLTKGDVSAKSEVVAEHKDIDDADQTVEVAHKLSTNAVEGEVETPEVDGVFEDEVDASVNNLDEDKVIDPADGAENYSIVDTVTYEGLKPGVTYTLNGSLMVKETGEPATDAAGQPIQNTTQFTPETEGKETVDLGFSFDAATAEKYAGKTLVVFEEVTVEEADSNGNTGTVVVGEHKDINDAAQSIRIKHDDNPTEITLKTSASDQKDEDKIISSTGGTVVDVVTYTGLVPGKTYTVSGELMDKETGKGTGITGSTTFTADEADGSVEVEFSIPVGFIGKTLVAFETMTTPELDVDGEPVDVKGDGKPDNEIVVGEHKDINDEAQTVKVEKEGKEGGIPWLPLIPLIPIIGGLVGSSDGGSSTPREDEVQGITNPAPEQNVTTPEPEKQDTVKGISKTGQDKGMLANTGASVIGLIITATLILLGGIVLVRRRTQN